MSPTYMTVKFQTGWLPGAIGFTDAAKSALADELNIDKRVIRGSYAILGASRDPLIQEGAALKRLMASIRNQCTIPEYTLTSSASGTKTQAEKVAGSSLIEACAVEEFLSSFNAVRTQYLNWGKKVSEYTNYQKLKNADELALGKDWQVIAPRYPSAEALADAITCDMPRIEPFNASFSLEDLAPATANLLREQAEARLAASVDGAVSELILEFKEMVESVAKNCGKRIRLLPPMEHTRQDLRYAEVQTIFRHADDPTIPEDKMLVTVQRCSPKDNDSSKFIQTGKTEDFLWSQSDYNELRPYETDENKVLSSSSFDNLIWLAKKIQSVKSMLGEAAGAADLTKLAEEVTTTLGSMGGSAADITKQIKNSSFARAQTKITFNNFLDKLTTQEIEVRQQSKMRRKIKVGETANDCVYS